MSIHIICIIGEAQAIRFFVAILLPRKAVLWAAENGVVNGVGNSRFDPEGNVTREQMAVILFRYFGTFKGVEVSARADLSKFPDENRISYKHRTVELLPVLTGEFPPMLPKSPCEYAGIPCGLFVA